MILDPIVEELHRQREAYMKRLQYDLDAVVRDIKAHEASNPSPLLEPPVSPPPSRRIHRARSARR